MLLLKTPLGLGDNDPILSHTLGVPLVLSNHGLMKNGETPRIRECPLGTYMLYSRS